MFEELVDLTLDEYELFKLVLRESLANFSSFSEGMGVHIDLEPVEKGVSRVTKV